MRAQPIARGPLAFAFVLATLAACGPAPAERLAYIEVAAESIRTADPIPAPTADVVLTVGGDISKSNVGPTVSLDLATIEALGLVKYPVHDPWLDADHEFSGVLLADLLDTVGASSASRTIRLVALDDYEVEISIVDARRWPVLLATRMDGQPMSIEDKGPTRVVFPYDSFPEIDRLTYKDLWIWSVETIEVR